MVTKRVKILFQVFLLVMVFSLIGCNVIPVSPAPIFISLTPTTIPTATPMPATSLEIGIESADIDPDIMSYLVDNNPSTGEVIFHTITHPGLFKLDPATRILVPLLAAKSVNWKANENKWTTHVGFSNTWQWSDGSRLTAKDIEFSFNLYKSFADYRDQSVKEALKELSLSQVSINMVTFSTTRDPQGLQGLNSALVFPILQENFWKPMSIPVTGGETSPINDQLLLESLAIEGKQNSSNRFELERQQNILLQQVADSGIMLRNNEHKLQLMEDYLENKGGTNEKGLRDSEDVAKYRKLLPGMRSLIVLMRKMIGEQLDRLGQVNAELFRLFSTAAETHQKQAEALSSFILSVDGVDLFTEPLLIPYKIQKPVGDQPLTLLAVEHQEQLPDRIAFHIATSKEIHDQFTQGRLDAVFGDLEDKNPAATSAAVSQVHTTLLFNPNSETMIFPVLRQVMSCLLSSPVVWEDLPAYAQLQLKTISPTTSTPDCKGDSLARQAAMLMLLEKGGYTWQEDETGAVVMDSLKDPRGNPVSPITIASKPGLSLPSDTLDKLMASFEPLGIRINLLDPDAEQTSVTPMSNLTPDIRIKRWLETGTHENAICGLTGWLPESEFPVTYQQEIFTSCALEPIEIAPAQQPSPTPPVMMSGKVASDDLQGQLWMIDLFTARVFENWQPDVAARYTLDWMMPLQPADYSGWLE